MNNMNEPDPEQAGFFDLLHGHNSVDATSIAEDTSPLKTDQEAVESLQPSDADDNRAQLPHEARRALVGLLRHGVIMAGNKRLLFDALCRYQAPIQAHLADMYLRMLLDEKAGLAILLQQDSVDVDDTEDDISSLISRRTLSLYDTLLLLVLRNHYQDREAAGEQRVVIDIERIEIALRPFLPLTNSSRSDRRQLSGALQKMKERRLISAVRGEEERFEITSVIRYVVNAEFLEQMLTEYQKLVIKAGVSTTQGDSSER